MSRKRIVASSFAAAALTAVGVGLSAGVANAAEPTAGDYCVEQGGVAVIDDDTPNDTTCFWPDDTVSTNSGGYYFEYPIN